MNEKELEEEIRILHNNEKSRIDIDILADDFFIEQPEYLYLQQAFENTRYKKNGWKWHQLVRVVLESPSTRHYMYERLLDLILKHRATYNDYFELRTEIGTHNIPSPISDLNRLEIVFKEYLEIYHNIITNIHFNYTKNESIGQSIGGKINWQKTIQRSGTSQQLIFVTTIKERRFVTPENILLVLCAEWMYRESVRLLHIEFPEPLSDYKRHLLIQISEKMRPILEKFPFREVLNASRKFWALPFEDVRIKSLENEAWKRIKNKLVVNSDYSDLMIWIDKFRELNISQVSAATPTRHLLDSIENLDTVYEAWIFLEFVDYLSEKGPVDFQLGKEPHCKFSYDGVLVTFWYEKRFPKLGINTWVSEHRPDFTAMVGDEILCVFDAKNYTKSSPGSEAINQMLAYMINLDTNFGALLYPFYPKYWDDLNKSQRAASLRAVLKDKYVSQQNQLNRIVENLANLLWDDLPSEYNTIKPPEYVDVYENTQGDRSGKYHLNQTLCLFRVSPTASRSAISMRNKSLDAIYDSIISRVKAKYK